MDFEIKGKTQAETLENVSFLVLFVAAALVFIGVSVGTFVPGIPVALAIGGAFLVVVGLVLYLASEFMEILSE